MIARKSTARVLFILVAFLAAGCISSQPETVQIQGASITGATLQEASAGEQAYFIIHVQKYGDPVGIDFRGVVLNGQFKIRLVNAAGEIAWQEQVQAGNFTINTTLFDLPPGEYQLGLAWDGLIEASFNLRWMPGPIEAPLLSPGVLVSGIGMLAVALGFIAFARIRHLGWRFLILGGFFWLIAVLLKTIFALQVNASLQQLLTSRLAGWLATPLFYLFIGSFTGVFEVGVVGLILRYSRFGKASWSQALAFGIGFGSFEALLLGFYSLVYTAMGLFNSNLLPPNLIEGMQALNNPLYSLAPVVERFAIIWVHIFSTVLLFYSLASNQARWFWMAFLYKSLVDAVAAFGQFTSLENLVTIWAFEAIMLMFGLVGWGGTRNLRNRYPDSQVTVIR